MLMIWMSWTKELTKVTIAPDKNSPFTGTGKLLKGRRSLEKASKSKQGLHSKSFVSTIMRSLFL